MNLLFSMSLAGSLVFILYLIIKPVTKRYLPVSWRYWLLKVSILFYLVPYQYYKYYYLYIVEFLFPGWQENTGSKDPVSTNKIILIDSEGHFLSIKNQTAIFTILGIWGVLAILFLLYRLVKYIYCMKDLRQISKLPVIMPDEQPMSKRRPRAKVTLFANQYITTPFTVGLFSPRIILPASLANKKESRMIIAHEMAHVRNRDNLVKFLWLLAMLFHWYNPLIYLLYREICRVSEQVCDASVVQGMSEQEKKQYQLLIIELGQKNQQRDTLLASAFSGHFRMIKERITIMDRKPTSSKKTRFVSSLAIAVIILALSPISVLAYSPMVAIERPDESFTLDADFIANELDVCDPFLEHGTLHDIFIADDGQVYIIENRDPQIERAACPHNWQDGISCSHVTNDDGGCTITYYNCEYCTRCNLRRNLTFKNAMTYVICTH